MYRVIQVAVCVRSREGYIRCKGGKDINTPVYEVVTMVIVMIQYYQV